MRDESNPRENQHNFGNDLRDFLLKGGAKWLTALLALVVAALLAYAQAFPAGACIALTLIGSSASAFLIWRNERNTARAEIARLQQQTPAAPSGDIARMAGLLAENENQLVALREEQD